MRPFTQTREAVRVKVKKYDGKLPPDIQKFSVDPQITSLDVLQSILIKAFNLKDDFSLSYKIANDGHNDYMGLFSDWDLDAAFLRAQNVQGSEPCVHLRVDVKSRNDAPNSDEYNINSKWQSKSTGTGIFKNAPQNPAEQKSQSGLQGIFMNQMEKTLNMVSRALNLTEDPDVPIHQPLNDAKFRSFLDPVGQVIDSGGLRDVIYSGGIDPSLRRVVWKHILNVYPEGMSGKQRMDYMKKKSLEYLSLRDVWRDCIHKGQVPSDLMYVTSMVKKDVLRTDRHHKFYAGSDDNQHIASLFNILTTYALNHPVVSYCQGMSDLASPLLVTMGDEAHAYICFCALMTRLHPNFLFDGEAMTLKFSHLTESLQVYDPQFYTYLKNQQADDLLFCYRWLLLEMKREFAFDDALRMLEVLWSSLPPRPPTKELLLKDKSFCPLQDESDVPISPLVKNHGENAYTKLCAMRRQHSSGSLTPSFSTVHKTITYKRINQSLDENIGKNCQNTNSLQFSKEFQSLDDAIISSTRHRKNLSGSNFNMLHKSRSKTTSCSSNNSVSSCDRDYHYSQLADDDSVFGDSGHDNISNTNHSDSKEHLLQPLLPDKLQRDASPVKIIENFNEFKKLSLYAHRNKSATKVNSNSDKQLVNCNNKVSEDSKQLDNTLKEYEYEDSSPDDSKDYSPMTTSITTELKLESDNFDKVLCRQCRNTKSTSHLEDIKCTNSDCNSQIDYTNPKSNTEVNSCQQLSDDNLDCNNLVEETNPKTNSDGNSCRQLSDDKFNVKSSDNVFLWENPLHEKIQGIDETNPTIPNITGSVNDVNISSNSIPGTSKPSHSNTLPRDSSKSNSRFFSNMSQELENARKNCETILNNKKPPNLQSIAVTISNFQNKYENHLHSSSNTDSNSILHNTSLPMHDTVKTELNYIKELPSPELFGGGNPFLMFLCLTVLMQHRDHIMTNRMDYNELAMHFDKMVRKHNVNRVLNQARQMYSQYIKHQNTMDSK